MNGGRGTDQPYRCDAEPRIRARDVRSGTEEARSNSSLARSGTVFLNACEIQMVACAGGRSMASENRVGRKGGVICRFLMSVAQRTKLSFDTRHLFYHAADSDAANLLLSCTREVIWFGVDCVKHLKLSRTASCTRLKSGLVGRRRRDPRPGNADRRSSIGANLHFTPTLSFVLTKQTQVGVRHIRVRSFHSRCHHLSFLLKQISMHKIDFLLKSWSKRRQSGWEDSIYIERTQRRDDSSSELQATPYLHLLPT